MKNLAFLVVLLLSLTAFSQDTTKQLNAIFTEIKTYENSLQPQDSLYRALHIKGRFSRVTEASYRAESAQYRKFLARLNAIRDSDLSRQEYISKQLMLFKLEDLAAATTYNMYLIPMNAEQGFFMRINGALKRLPFTSVQEYEDYFAWLPKYVVWLEDHLKLMQIGIRKGIVAPKVVIQNNIEFLKPWLSDDVDTNPFYRPLRKIPADWDQEVINELRKKAANIINKQLIPAHKKIDAFLRTNYMNASPEKPGVMYLTNGKAYYENRIRHYTTLEMTPDYVHLLGVQEVARIKNSMLAIIEETGFEGSFEDFLTFLRNDAQFYAKTPQELLNFAAWLSKKAEGELPKLFKKLYSLPFTVAPVPADIAPTYTGGRYAEGSWEQKRAGAFWVNTYKLDSRTLYTIPSLTLHEAVPGHHLQISIARELDGIPKFRNNYYISAFGEGWGLYSEYLGEEMGMYTTPYERFGRYTYEMWRACRLVVDTGIHYKGWTREKALDYMKSNTALSLHEVTTEIDRYIGWPGQAVSYKIGELKIKSLRKTAEELLGEKFDIREFHYHILKNGSVQLPILEEEINVYINSVLENN